MTKRQSSKLVEEFMRSFAANDDTNSDCDSLHDEEYKPDSDDNRTSSGLGFKCYSKLLNLTYVEVFASMHCYLTYWYIVIFY